MPNCPSGGEGGLQDLDQIPTCAHSQNFRPPPSTPFGIIKKYGDANLCSCACIWYCNLIWCTIHIDHPRMTMHEALVGLAWHGLCTGGGPRIGLAGHGVRMRERRSKLCSCRTYISQCPNSDSCVYLVSLLFAS